MPRLVYEKEFAKTFDPVEEQFVLLKNIKDLDELERRRYIISQINLITTKLDSIEKLINSGNFSESREMILKKVSDFEHRSNKISLKSDFFSLTHKETEQKLISVAEESHNFASISETEGSVKSIVEMEKKFGVHLLPKAKNMLLGLVEGIELLNLRSKNLELALLTLRDLKVGQKINLARKTIESTSKKDNDEEILSRIEKKSTFFEKTKPWDSITESLKKIKSKKGGFN